MNVLAIYDSSGTIWTIAQGDEITKPDGLPSVFVNVPNTGCVLEKIDVSDPDHPKPVFSYPAESEVGQLTEKVEKQDQDILDVKQDVIGYEKIAMYSAFSFTDQQALNVSNMYPLWSDLADGTTLTTQKEAVNGTEITRVRGEDGNLYKVIQTHNKQSDWAPDAAPSLFAKVLIVDPSVVPEWEQPLSTNGYSTGDRVTHGGKTWESLVDNNVWEPGAVGTESVWKEVASDQ